MNTYWRESAATVRFNIRPFIAGRYRDSSAADRFENINPASEAVLCAVSVGDVRDIDAAVQAARRRFNDGCWSELPPVRRAEILMKLADLIVRHKSEIALLDSLEMGKPISAALYDAEVYAPTLLRSWAGFADKLVGESAPLTSGSWSFNAYEPRGVVGAIAPWNFPSVNAVYKFGPALAAGNTVVLKPSELSASSALRLAELALEAGVPEGVFNVIPGLGSTVGAALASHADVDLLTFTGSTATGRRLMEQSGRSNGKPLILECGGKSPQLVFKDIEFLDDVADAVAQGILWNSGQVCSAHTRLLVHKPIKHALLEKVVSRVRSCRPADPLDPDTTFGPLASPTQRSRVKNYIAQGLNSGAQALLLAKVQETGGCYVSPTIFDNVDTTMAIVREEIFGPVLCVQQFDTEAEAIALANATEYGLTATVWTRDLGRGKRLAHAIRAGAVAIRTKADEGPDSGCMLSFEPQRASGFGSEIGLKGLQSYSTLKLISIAGG